MVNHCLWTFHAAIHRQIVLVQRQYETFFQANARNRPSETLTYTLVQDENVHNARSEVTTNVASIQHSFHVAPMKGALVAIAFSFTFLT